ncbi:MAG: YicC family protein [Clostridiaceae bacterium]|nr:YicC family protein [Clostridiaceae bacterium]
MIKSMTGFGRCEKITSEYKLTIEVKSVNHRYCDINIKLPKKFNAFEGKLRNMIKEYAGRGKIDVFVSYENYCDSELHVRYHESVAADYVDAVRRAGESFGLEQGLSGASLIRLPEVITMEEQPVDTDRLFPVLEETLRGACREFLAARETEGECLKKDIMAKLDYVDRLVSCVEKRSPQVLAEYRRKIENKVAELLGDKQVDEAVLVTELTIYADKICVDEETVRLRSHIQGMRNALGLDEPIGRKLDFLAQEMNREANTILSKANDNILSDNAIDLKTEIEKIREQIQNIE